MTNTTPRPPSRHGFDAASRRLRDLVDGREDDYIDYGDEDERYSIDYSGTGHDPVPHTGGRLRLGTWWG